MFVFGINFPQNFISVAKTVFRTRLTTTRDRNLQLRPAVSTGCFFEFLQWILSFSPVFMCNSVRGSPQNVEKIARFPGGEICVKSCHVSGCHGFFSVPIFSGIHSPKNYSTRIRLRFSGLHAKIVGNCFLENSYLKEYYWNQFRNDFRLECIWSLYSYQFMLLLTTTI